VYELDPIVFPITADTDVYSDETQKKYTGQENIGEKRRKGFIVPSNA